METTFLRFSLSARMGRPRLALPSVGYTKQHKRAWMAAGVGCMKSVNRPLQAALIPQQMAGRRPESRRCAAHKAVEMVRETNRTQCYNRMAAALQVKSSNGA